MYVHGRTDGPAWLTVFVLKLKAMKIKELCEETK